MAFMLWGPHILFASAILHRLRIAEPDTRPGYRRSITGLAGPWNGPCIMGPISDLCGLTNASSFQSRRGRRRRNRDEEVGSFPYRETWYETKKTGDRKL